MPPEGLDSLLRRSLFYPCSSGSSRARGLHRYRRTGFSTKLAIVKKGKNIYFPKENETQPKLRIGNENGSMYKSVPMFCAFGVFSTVSQSPICLVASQSAVLRSNMGTIELMLGHTTVQADKLSRERVRKKGKIEMKSERASEKGQGPQARVQGACCFLSPGMYASQISRGTFVIDFLSTATLSC